MKDSGEPLLIVYISGPFRHYLPDGTFDHEKMNAEIEDERRWAGIIARSGCGWFAPLANTHFLQGVISDDEFIRRDIEFIGCLRPGIDMILLRLGSLSSEGSQRELEAAERWGLEVLHGIQGTEVVAERLSAKVEGRLEELEDALDVAEAERRPGEPTIPFEQVKKDLGL